MRERLRWLPRCGYWTWHDVSGDWYVLRCVSHRWHVTMHLIDPLADVGLNTNKR